MIYDLMKSEVKTCYTGGMSLLITSGGYNKPITNKKNIFPRFSR